MFTKTTIFDCVINEKCYSVDGGRGICPLFFCPHPGGFDSLRVPSPRNLSSKAQKKLMPGGQKGRGGAGGRWTQLELTDALNYLAHPNNA